ncbi:MAG: Nramp family divalent metal transporter, partial [Bryobacteraceae bacterium]
YTALERLLVGKLFLVLGYLGFISLFWVSWATWREIWSGFLRFGALPPGEIDWSLLAGFAAIAGAGGLSNTTLSGYVRDKGWGMGATVGAIPSAVGGRTIALSHTGSVFDETKPDNLRRWRGWLAHVRRDQLLLWAPGCVLGMALPAMMSYEFIRGAHLVSDHAASALTAQAIADQHGRVFWYLTLLCGFMIMAPTQVSQLDGIARRWTDVIWIGSRRFRNLEGNEVKKFTMAYWPRIVSGV